ncbi:hypothetical protein [Mycobacterium sp. M23085]|uniref:hypothetical protein n=1 Tax=Mycobacterium sp. M23085 TaxID=3378087 RepID=UPI003877C742
MSEIISVPPLIQRCDVRSDLVLDDNGTQIALYSVAFEAVGGATTTLGFSSDGVSTLIRLLQEVLAGTLEKQFDAGP